MIALYNKNKKEPLPSVWCENDEKGFQIIDDWLNKKYFDKSVFVCFANWKISEGHYLRDEQDSILVSHNYDEIYNFIRNALCRKSSINMNLVIMEFHSYKQAFEFCIDLREGF